MTTATWEHNGTTYETRRETIKDSMKADTIARRFPPDDDWQFVRTFTRFALLTTVNGGHVLGRPIAGMGMQELHDAAEQWGEDDPDMAYLFFDALNRAKSAHNAAHLQPGADAGNSPAPNDSNG